ncbi:hypothetical protein DSL64_24735 [Dyadobacter luteus]|jgi:hypothetical protein|uniref:Uncharacterized protein n=1 Tax=Dyadobacter luteus TaxID=2259619 RepID=A0A3D8Y5F1_9BACT|nr:hypothetical protein [Dyadobacter luteus]REA57166.1 hypothetical protein DSL64_24735 [Dyadobacter luteus]
METCIDAPLVIKHSDTLYGLHLQYEKHVVYEELVRNSDRSVVSTQRLIETSRRDLFLRIQKEDITVMVPSKSHLANVRQGRIKVPIYKD